MAYRKLETVKRRRSETERIQQDIASKRKSATKWIKGGKLKEKGFSKSSNLGRQKISLKFKKLNF